MPEIKIKHVISFSSEDKVHKAENLLQPEAYRMWKCATPGEKKAIVVLQFEKATQIHSIDIGNASSAFVEVLVGRSSDTVNDYQVLLVASSFMSPIESRTDTHNSRVRMFGPEKLNQSTKDEKWDCVQVVCTQPFNSRITYGLKFIRFNSPSEKVEEISKSSGSETAVSRIGAFKLRKEEEDDDDDSSLSAGSFFEKQKTRLSQSDSKPQKETEPSYASVVLASATDADKVTSQNNVQKRKIDAGSSSDEPPVKKASTTLNKDNIIYKDVLRDLPENKNSSKTTGDLKNSTTNSKVSEHKKKVVTTPSNTPEAKKNPPSSNDKQVLGKTKDKVPFQKLLDKVVFVLSGFVNPLRGVIRDKAIAMGAKYKADWDNSCTHLICAFINTPKYQQVKKLKGRIVSKDWIFDCFKKRQHIPWTKYMLDKPSKNDTSSEESDYSEGVDDTDEDSDYIGEAITDSEEEYKDKKKKEKRNKQNNVKKVNKAAENKVKTPPSSNKVKQEDNKNAQSSTSSKNSSQSDSDFSEKKHNSSDDKSLLDTFPVLKDESETEDEEVLKDYLADTDPDVDSGEETDELLRVEVKPQSNGGSPPKNRKLSDSEDLEYSEKPDVTDLPLPELPNLFKQKHFFLHGEFSSSNRHDLQRYITAYNGVIEDSVSNKVKYVITEGKWDKQFEDILSENEDLIFVKPTWIYKCHDLGKLVPYQPYITIPDS